MKKLIFGVLFVSILFTTVSCGNNQNTKQAEWVNDEILTQLNADPVFPALYLLRVCFFLCISYGVPVLLYTMW